MGDEKPSHLLQRMRSMVDRNVLDSVSKTVSLEQVPQSLYDVLAVNTEAGLTTLALLTDRVTWKGVLVATVAILKLKSAPFTTKQSFYQKVRFL